MRSIRLCLVLLLAAVALVPFPSAAAAEGAAVHAFLVIASNQPGKSDPRLAPYEANLRRILRFESFRVVGEDSATLSASGQANLSLGQGHSLALSGQNAGGSNRHLTAKWSRNGQSLMSTGLQLNRGIPAIIGGPPSGEKGDAYAVILIAN